MRSLTPLAFAGLLAGLPVVATSASPALQTEKTEKKSQAVVAEPSSIAPGQSVTLRWLFTGSKVTVSGGRFGKGIVVTGRSSITDKPARTTRYIFNVDYVGQRTNATTGKVEMKPLHATYNVVAVVAQVSQPVAPISGNFSVYHDRYGWQIGVLKGWKRDNVDLPDPSNNGLMYFQQEDDSVERLAISILPAGQMNVAELMSKVQKSLSSNYEQIQVLSDQEQTFADVPAVLSTFTGMDAAHPGTRTQSMILAFIKNGRAYVVSGRTAATQFSARKPLIEKMVKSMSFTTVSAAK